MHYAVKGSQYDHYSPHPNGILLQAGLHGFLPL